MLDLSFNGTRFVKLLNQKCETSHHRVNFELRHSMRPFISHLRRPYRSVAYPNRIRDMSSQHVSLKFSDGPLVWIDCEMTGLDPDRHKIMGDNTFNRFYLEQFPNRLISEIAVLITNGNLALV